MPRKKRTLDRDSGLLRDASLIVIASEDRYAVKQYFSRFQFERVFVSVLHTDEGDGPDPRNVLQRLIDYARENATVDGDSLWICIDRDRWTEEMLIEVNRECRQRGYNFAISKPCFELWLLLHHVPLPADLPGNSNCKALSDRLADALKPDLGGYSKQCCKSMTLTEDQVRAAIARAKEIDQHGDNPLPPTMQTRVYCIWEEILSKNRVIDFASPIA